MRLRQKRCDLERLITPEEARTKIRTTFSSAFEIALAGFMAGVCVIASLSLTYFGAFALGSALHWHRLSAAQQVDRLLVMIGLHGIGATLGVSVALLAMGALFGAMGAVAGLILHYELRGEPIKEFIWRKGRFPTECAPFVFFFLLVSFRAFALVPLYLVMSFGLTFLWKFWYRLALSQIRLLK